MKIGRAKSTARTSEPSLHYAKVIPHPEKPGMRQVVVGNPVTRPQRPAPHPSVPELASVADDPTVQAALATVAEVRRALLEAVAALEATHNTFQTGDELSEYEDRERRLDLRRVVRGLQRDLQVAITNVEIAQQQAAEPVVETARTYHRDLAARYLSLIDELADLKAQDAELRSALNRAGVKDQRSGDFRNVLPTFYVPSMDRKHIRSGLERVYGPLGERESS